MEAKEHPNHGQHKEAHSGQEEREILKRHNRRHRGFSFNVFRNKRLAMTLVGAVIIITGAVVATLAMASAPGTNITINGSLAGPVFQGIGAISGGGGNSRLLIDYQEPERSQILDYMFKPNFGANLQILKLEIGGDADSTTGSEPSIEHTKGQIDCNTGYEWWLAEQAIQRNPAIKIYGLQWAAPGWVGDGNQTVWTPDDVKYVTDWMNCAKSHGITISYLGGWNESGWNATWEEEMRSALNSNGYGSTQLVTADSISNPWAVASALATDSKFKAATSILGVHDVCPGPLPATTTYSCQSNATAKSLGMPLWESEDGSMDSNSGAPIWARSINYGYIDAGVTGNIQWPIISSIPQGLYFSARGLVTANNPWSGNYSVDAMTWAYAHTTQFTQAGWKFVGGASGKIGTSGTYVTYQAPNHSAWSMVAENTGSSGSQTVSPQTIGVSVTGGLPNTTVHVWQSMLSSDQSQWFVQQPDITTTSGTFTYTIPAGAVVTFTTTTGQSKGSEWPGPVATSLTLPYSNLLATDDGSEEPSLLAPQDGAFEIRPCLGGIGGTCTQQTVPTKPVLWIHQPTAYPYAVVGNTSWSDYTASVKMLFTQSSGSGGVVGRFNSRTWNNSYGFDGYVFHVAASGKWQILKNYGTTSPTILASGTTTALSINTWHTVAFTLSGSNLTGTVDGKTVGSAIDTSYTHGSVGIEAGAFTNTWPVNQYSNLSVATVATTTTVTGPIKSGLPGICLDDTAASTTDGNPIQIWACNGGPAQNWTPASANTIQFGGKCLDILGAGTANGTKVDLYTCNGGANQVWQPTGGVLVNPVSGKCLDDTAQSTTNGTKLEIYTCNGGANQKWTLPK